MPPRPLLGVCTWTFGERSLVDIARRLQSLEYDGVELLGDLSRYTAREAHETLARHELAVFSLTPANVDIAHPDTAVRTAAIAYYRRLLDFAAELGESSDTNPLVSVHGYVGRVAAVSSQAAEYALLVTAVAEIAREARARGLRLVFEVLNRYESHLVNTAAQANQLVEDVGTANLGILLDAYHMNIEEQDPARAIIDAGSRLWLYHMADSNRQGIGRGHTKLGVQLWALENVGYDGPIIMECTAPGPNPFIPIKDEDSLTWLETYLRESRSWF